MRVLSLAGRSHEALDAYRRLQQTLKQELGLDPSAELRSLQHAILASESLRPPAVPVSHVSASVSARVPAPASAQVPAPAPVAAPINRAPALLPPDMADFVGREQIVADAERWLLSQDPDAAAGRVLSLTGMPGVGKTALAIRLAHRVKCHFPGGQLYAATRGTSAAPATPRDVLLGFLRAAGALPGDRDIDTEDACQLFRAWCSRREVLIVLDDAASAWQIGPLLPSNPRCALIVTSRFMYDLPGARRAQVDPLAVGDGLRLLGILIGHKRLEAEVDAAMEILRLVGHLPLAIRAVGVRLAAAPCLPLSQFTRHLAATPTRLTELSVGDIDVRARYNESYDKLEEREKWAFRLLGLVGGRSFSSRDVAKLLGCTPLITGMVLARLVEYQLLTMVDEANGEAPAYIFPELARIFASERLAEVAGSEMEIYHLRADRR
jgi:hypothetical protein